MSAGRTAAATGIDRGALVRRSLVDLVAERGLHATSVAAVAAHAGVAAGTVYVHYGSKDDLVVAAFRDVKRRLGEAATRGVDQGAPPQQRFRRIWLQAYEFLAGDPASARFLVQLEASPYARAAHGGAADAPGPGAGEEPDPLTVAVSAPDLASLLVELPPAVLYDLGLGPAVRLVAAGVVPAPDAVMLDRLATACWRAVTRP